MPLSFRHCGKRESVEALSRTLENRFPDPGHIFVHACSLSCTRRPRDKDRARAQLAAFVRRWCHTQSSFANALASSARLSIKPGGGSGGPCHGMRVSASRNAQGTQYNMRLRARRIVRVPPSSRSARLGSYHVKVKLPRRLSTDNEERHCVLDPHGEKAAVKLTANHK